MLSMFNNVQLQIANCIPTRPFNKVSLNTSDIKF